ncbi:hypothetical protein T01_3044 [Trichinella spiralis]|uniref:Uncharacterized protein n=1 Tax=Trichinella spiralis TaxID=6334 RepID=A0A0V1BKI7_TRISP|nr:hypothetical protein T01_3044 [Trichinella spiralis]
MLPIKIFIIRLCNEPLSWAGSFITPTGLLTQSSLGDEGPVSTGGSSAPSYLPFGFRRLCYPFFRVRALPITLSHKQDSIPLFTVALLLFFHFIRYTTSPCRGMVSGGRNGLPHGPFPHRPCLPGTCSIPTFSRLDMVRPTKSGHPVRTYVRAPFYPSKRFADAVPGLLWLGPCRTATLVRGAGVGHILPWFPPARRVAARISSHPLVALAPSQTLSGRLCHQWCGGRWTGMPEAPVEMDIPVLRLLNGHFRQHVYKCSVHPLYQTVRLWVVSNAEQPAYLSYHLCLEVTALV